MVPYRLPEWINRDTVYVTEGEKDADNLCGWGLPATTNSGGAGGWRDEYDVHFSGKKVAIFPDNDRSGEQHARTVAGHLLPVAGAVKIVRLPGLPPKGDFSDWMAAGGTRDKLAELVRATPILTTADVAGWKQPSEPIGILLSEVKPERVNWLWRNRIPTGRITILDGDPGMAKSLLSLDVAARVSVGKPFPGDDSCL